MIFVLVVFSGCIRVFNTDLETTISIFILLSHFIVTES